MVRGDRNRRGEKRKERRGGSRPLDVGVNAEEYFGLSEEKLLYGVCLPVNTPVRRRRKMPRT
jgi:hypothetical protein